MIVLLTHPKYALPTNASHVRQDDTKSSDPSNASSVDLDPEVFQPFIQKLHMSGHIVENLKITPNQYTAIARIPKTDPPLPHRQITFHFVAWNAFVFAELYHTGSQGFASHVREQAAKLGFELGTDYLMKRKNILSETFGKGAMEFLQETSETKEYREGDLVLLSSEEDIFRFLNMKYVPPFERNW